MPGSPHRARLALLGQRDRGLRFRQAPVPHGADLDGFASVGVALVDEIALLEKRCLLRRCETVPYRADADGTARLQVPGVHRVPVLENLVARAQVQPGCSERGRRQENRGNRNGALHNILLFCAIGRVGVATRAMKSALFSPQNRTSTSTCLSNSKTGAVRSRTV